MRRWCVVALVGLLALAGVTGWALHPQDEIAKLEKDGFVKLFDGKTVSGWKTVENPAAWTALPDGTMRGTGERSHLFSPKEYTDFEFRAEVLTKPRANSGMFFRAKMATGWPAGYEAQVCNTHPDKRKTGSLWGFVDVTERLASDNEWWTEHIICQGNHIVIKINGKQVVDFKDPKNTYTKGHLALQQHDSGSTVFYRNVMVKNLAK